MPRIKGMDKLFLFTDGSVNNQTNIGFGACLFVDDYQLSLDELKAQVKIKRFENTSSTKLELQTLLWALTKIQTVEQEILVYTDSQNIIGLLDRRKRLEKQNFKSKNNVPLKNENLYREFYRVVNTLQCEFVKVKGHKPGRQKNKTDQIFTLVDRASRNALRDST